MAVLSSYSCLIPPHPAWWVPWGLNRIFFSKTSDLMSWLYASRDVHSRQNGPVRLHFENETSQPWHNHYFIYHQRHTREQSISRRQTANLVIFVYTSLWHLLAFRIVNNFFKSNSLRLHFGQTGYVGFPGVSYHFNSYHRKQNQINIIDSTCSTFIHFSFVIDLSLLILCYIYLGQK